MKHFSALLATVSLVALSACASIVSGSSQKVQVSTNPPSQSYCALSNKQGGWNITAPGQTEVKRSKTDLVIQCNDQASGVTGSQAVESSLEPWFLGNILFGGIIGAPIDFATGAAWQYPSSVNVPLKTAYQPPTAPSAPPAPVTTPAPAATPTPQSYQPAPASTTTYYAPATAAPTSVAPAPAGQYQYIPPSQLNPIPATR